MFWNDTRKRATRLRQRFDENFSGQGLDYTRCASQNAVSAGVDDSMAIFFKASISEERAFERLEELFSGPCDHDGYLNVFGERSEETVSWVRGMSSDEFRAEITEAFRQTWDAAPHWLVYIHREETDDMSTNDIRRAAISLTRSYTGSVVVTLSILGRRDSTNDLELVFLCFTDDAQRRNFKVRYEGKFVPELPAVTAL